MCAARFVAKEKLVNRPGRMMQSSLLVADPGGGPAGIVLKALPHTVHLALGE